MCPQQLRGSRGDLGAGPSGVRPPAPKRPLQDAGPPKGKGKGKAKLLPPAAGEEEEEGDDEPAAHEVRAVRAAKCFKGWAAWAGVGTLCRVRPYRDIIA